MPPVSSSTHHGSLTQSPTVPLSSGVVRPSKPSVRNTPYSGRPSRPNMGAQSSGDSVSSSGSQGAQSHTLFDLPLPTHARTPISHPNPDSQLFSVQPAAGRTDVVDHIPDPDLLQMVQNAPDVQEPRDMVQHFNQLSLDFPFPPAPQSIHSDRETFVSSTFVFVWVLLTVYDLFGLAYGTSRRNHKAREQETPEPGLGMVIQPGHSPL